MPTRVFSQFDATTVQFTVDPAGLVISGIQGGTTAALSTELVQTGVGSWEMSINLSGSAAPDESAVTRLVAAGPGALIQRWEVDYDNFPSIPTNARVKKLTFNRPRSVNYTFSADANIGGMDFRFYSNAIQTPIYFTIVNESPYISPKVVSETINGLAANEILFDHTGGPTFITKAELIASWSEFNNNIYGLNVNNIIGEVGIAHNCGLNGTLVFGLGWTVTVEYEEGFEWDIPQDPSEPISEGSTVILTSPKGAPLAVDFTDITQIDILIPNYAIPGTFITVNVLSGTWSNITANTLNFIMPSWAGNLPTVIIVRLTSTQFTGTVALQLYTILFVSASGIYELVPGKINDTLYIEEEPGVTIDVKIPNPFGRTGFFGK